VKPFICTCRLRSSRKGEGLIVGKGVKSTHSDPGWLVFDFSTRASQHCLTWGGHSIYAVVTTLSRLLTLDTKKSLCTGQGQNV